MVAYFIECEDSILRFIFLSIHISLLSALISCFVGPFFRCLVLCSILVHFKNKIIIWLLFAWDKADVKIVIRKCFRYVLWDTADANVENCKSPIKSIKWSYFVVSRSDCVAFVYVVYYTSAVLCVFSVADLHGSLYINKARNLSRVMLCTPFITALIANQVKTNVCGIHVIVTMHVTQGLHQCGGFSWDQRTFHMMSWLRSEIHVFPLNTLQWNEEKSNKISEEIQHRKVDVQLIRLACIERKKTQVFANVLTWLCI